MQEWIFKSWEMFLNNINSRISSGEFQDFLRLEMLKNNQFDILCDDSAMFDVDYLELDEWEGFYKMFPTEKSYKEMQMHAPIIELRYFRVPVSDRNLVFYVVGEELPDMEGYVCYGYGFVDETETDNRKYDFKCFMSEKGR